MPETDTSADEQADTTATEQASETDEASVDWKAKAREWEKRAKQNTARIAELEPKAKQFEIFEAASKSELERAQEQATALQQELASTQREAMIASVALEARLEPSLVKRLNRDLTSREDLLADALELKAEFGTPGTTRAPAPDRSQGSSATAATTDPAQQFASIIRGQLGS